MRCPLGATIRWRKRRSESTGKGTRRARFPFDPSVLAAIDCLWGVGRAPGALGHWRGITSHNLLANAFLFFPTMPRNREIVHGNLALCKWPHSWVGGSGVVPWAGGGACYAPLHRSAWI